jgi:hypothetical protein
MEGWRREPTATATIRDTSHGGAISSQARACQVRSRRRRWPERPDFTGRGMGRREWEMRCACRLAGPTPVRLLLASSLRAVGSDCRAQAGPLIKPPRTHLRRTMPPQNCEKITHSIGRRPLSLLDLFSFDVSGRGLFRKPGGAVPEIRSECGILHE